MGNAKEKENRCKAIDAWLAIHLAECLWQKKLANGLVEAWRVGPRVCIVMRYGRHGENGWDIYTSNTSNETALSLLDAEVRLGVRKE